MNTESRYIYLRLQLDRRTLSEELRERLEQLEVACVQEAGPHCAYGIVEADDELAKKRVSFLPEVAGVSVAAPPSGF